MMSNPHLSTPSKVKRFEKVSKKGYETCQEREKKRKSMQIISCPAKCLCESSMQMLILDQDAHGGGESGCFSCIFFPLLFSFVYEIVG